jgi:hypothetical protein
VFHFVVRTWQVGIAHEKLGKVSTWPWLLLEKLTVQYTSSRDCAILTLKLRLCPQQ